MSLDVRDRGGLGYGGTRGGWRIRDIAVGEWGRGGLGLAVTPKAPSHHECAVDLEESHRGDSRRE